jgi:5-methylcytosine-specific restriction endonuclease McrA
MPRTNKEAAADIIRYRLKHAKGHAAGRRRRMKKVSSGRKARTWKRGDDFYTSDLWRSIRYEALVRDGGKCCACGRTAKNGVVLHVDHIKPRSKFPELQFELHNLQTLCEDCNIGKSDTDQTDWRAGGIA